MEQNKKVEKEVVNTQLAEQKKAEISLPKTAEKTTKNNAKKQSVKTIKKPLEHVNRTPADGLIEKNILIKRISKTTKGGRKLRFSVLLVVGDKKGTVGFGMGKAAEIPNAIKKASKNARNNLVKVAITKSGTIYHDIIGKACAAKVLLKPAPAGTGIVAGGGIRAVIELAGYNDIYTKNLGKNTAVNMIQATINGLKRQLSPEYIAFMRDKDISNL